MNLGCQVGIALGEDRPCGIARICCDNYVIISKQGVSGARILIYALLLMKFSFLNDWRYPDALDTRFIYILLFMLVLDNIVSFNLSTYAVSFAFF